MDSGSSSESLDRGQNLRGGKRNGPVPAKVEPFTARTEHNPRELRSWAKRTGFVSYSAEAGTSASEKYDSVGFDLERGLDRKNGGSSPKIEIDPILGRTRPNRANEIEPASVPAHGGARNENDENQRRGNENEPILGFNDEKVSFKGNGNANGIMNRETSGQGIAAVAPVSEEKKEDNEIAETDVKVNLYPEGEEPVDEGWQRPSGLKFGLRENPGFG